MEEIGHPANRPQFVGEAIQRHLLHGLVDFVRHPLAELLGQPIHHRCVAQPNEPLGDLVGGQREAGLGENFGFDLDGQDLAVHEDAVTIEDDQIALHACRLVACPVRADPAAYRCFVRGWGAAIRSDHG